MKGQSNKYVKDMCNGDFIYTIEGIKAFLKGKWIETNGGRYRARHEDLKHFRSWFVIKPIFERKQFYCKYYHPDWRPQYQLADEVLAEEGYVCQRPDFERKQPICGGKPRSISLGQYTETERTIMVCTKCQFYLWGGPMIRDYVKDKDGLVVKDKNGQPMLKPNCVDNWKKFMDGIKQIEAAFDSLIDAIGEEDEDVF